MAKKDPAPAKKAPARKAGAKKGRAKKAGVTKAPVRKGAAKRTVAKKAVQPSATGTHDSRAVRRYLEALERQQSRRPRRSRASIERRLAAIDEATASASPLRRLSLSQKRIDLSRALETEGERDDLAALEADFVKAALPYSRRKGITYAAWRAAGVEARLLKAAGVGRGGG